MQQALQIQTQVDQALVDAIPALKPLLGHRVQVIALDLEQSTIPAGIDASQSVGAEAPAEGKLTFDEFLATRPAWPSDRPALTLDEIEEGIRQGAVDSASL